ncbi:hypothetical protein DPMN_184638 [Dreissena polymorpha]|uniref:C1q domain-containing protein n=1 Tax=Dreissena polymorpha TaxID=45954 RepID=A0A9D4DJZ0_DREPO|nr:hypothetical protein DPMN_184638 [Dreissena polymorpha]
MFNEENAYDASNGHFTAPVDGLSFLTAHFCASEQKYVGFFIEQKYVGFFIEKGTADMSNFERFTATFEYHTSHTSCSSASTPVKVKRNEHVWVRMTYPYNASYVTEFAYAYNTFTGTLIQEL